MMSTSFLLARHIAVAAPAAPRRVSRSIRVPARCTAAAEAPLEPAARKARVVFKVPFHVEFGEQLCLVGSCDDLGNWSTSSCIPLSWSDGDLWQGECELAAGTEVEYKYIIRDEFGEVRQWQPCSNLVLRVDDAAQELTVQDGWNGESRMLLLGADVPVTAAAPEGTELAAEVAEVAADAELLAAATALEEAAAAAAEVPLGLAAAVAGLSDRQDMAAVAATADKELAALINEETQARPAVLSGYPPSAPASEAAGGNGSSKSGAEDALPLGGKRS